MKQIKKPNILPLAVLLIILMSSLTMAFGVAIPYWDSPEWYPLNLAPGESTIVQLTLQNTGDDNMTVKASITGSSIAQIDDKNNEYTVPSGEINKVVNIKVEIPEDAKIGTNYKVTASFQEVSSEDKGMISFAGAFTVDFPVKVVGKEDSEIFKESEQKPILPWIIFGILLLGIIILGIIKKRKKGKKK